MKTEKRTGRPKEGHARAQRPHRISEQERNDSSNAAGFDEKTWSTWVRDLMAKRVHQLKKAGKIPS